MFKMLFVLFTVASPFAHAVDDCRGELTLEIVKRFTARLRDGDGARVREALQNLVYMPLDQNSGLYTWWHADALHLAASSREHGSLAALVYLRFTDPDTWGDVRTLTDFAHLSPERQERFNADIRRAFARVRYRVTPTLDHVEHASADEWVIKGHLHYSTEFAATFFGTPLRFEGERLKTPSQLRVAISGANVLGSSYDVTLGAADGPDLAHVNFAVHFKPAVPPAANEALVIDTFIDHAHYGRVEVKIP